MTRAVPADVFGMNVERALRYVDGFGTKRQVVLQLVHRSFLSEPAKADF